MIATRLGQGVVVLLGAITLSFVLANLSGNPIDLLAGLNSTPEQRAALKHEYGYDKPIPARFVEYVVHAVQGDFGDSVRQPVSAFSLMFHALPYTLALVVLAMLVAVAVSVPIAVHSILRRNTRTDRSLRTALTVMQGLPEFWLAIVFVLVFSVWLGWFPVIGAGGPANYVLPVLAIAIPLMSTLVRLLRGHLLDIMGMEFVTALQAKGLSDRDIVVRHALRNTFPVTVTFLALQFGWMIGGTVIVETVFSWPGLGNLAVQATTNRDIPVIQAIVIAIAVVYILMNLLADLVAMTVDPRLREAR
ncbi:MAG TPA: ABC transporter permease [Baekduia sp.]|uniref:ABC transporter permease n=1 Tax=Baekduia sp. TaxID=2600305 RepID=UPI002D793FF4|nr:ABC transporter permease [Baekduia sp.]HET6507838.1 ABC transporter permease [Baekduia sp.]